MEPLFKDAQRLLTEARNQREALEASGALASAATASLRAAFSSNVEELAGLSTSLAALLRSTPAARREHSRRQLRRLDGDVADLRESYRRVAARAAAAAGEEDMRAELLQRRGGSGAVGGVGGGAGAAGGSRTRGDAAVTMEMGMDHERGALDRSEGATDALLATGRGALEALIAQRQRLKGTRRRVLDAAHALGVSQKLIARIERRDRMDALLVYAGIGVTVLLVILLWWWKRS
ncbi:hypothetical protein I4F81_006751 [Pyropia yezoensis]|uniref:Uncharacterized protein n=1 Tax=Pyropia yezoensis TaxID=2788 RepID=A0ACC3C363_PYRYE|nr:hypothetical protein I4F81_006751 [Neopyropia yezoensis]|eukprot:contig_1579_g238